MSVSGFAPLSTQNKNKSQHSEQPDDVDDDEMRRKYIDFRAV